MVKSSTAELSAMQTEDLKREIMVQELLVAKLRMGIALKKEKDTARLKKERRELARMQTAWTGKIPTPSSSKL